jgi:hypothetical protein
MTTAAGTPRYSRYKASKKLEGDSRRQALAAYVAHYAKIAEAQPELLNQKVPRAAFDSVLHEIGLLMQQRARELATGAGAVRDFLGKNPVPACLGGELTDEVRAFCLLLNALRQWSVGEQLAMDRLLLSGNVRKELKELYTICPVAPDDSDVSAIELHHPLRDGRPPLPLSKTGHARVEGLMILETGDAAGQKLVDFRKNSPSPISWKRLRVGCMVLKNEVPEGFETSYLTSAKGWIRRAMKQTALNETQILEFLDRYELGSLEE